MVKMIVLLRGINVGGSHKLMMSALQNALEKQGYEQVKTYINSGNVCLISKSEDPHVLQDAIHTLILETFGMDIAVHVIAGDTYREAINHAPLWWGDDSEAKHNVIFVNAADQFPALVLSVTNHCVAGEQVAAYAPAIFWSSPLTTYSAQRLSKIVASAENKYITIRNAKTVRALYDLLAEEKFHD